MSGGSCRGHWGRSYRASLPHAEESVMAGSSPCVAREMCSRMSGGSGCWDSVPGSLQLELGFKAVASKRETDR